MALAAATAAFTRTAESAQLTPMPVMLVSMAGPGSSSRWTSCRTGWRRCASAAR